MSDSTWGKLERVRDDCGYSELHSASEDGNVETVEMLVESCSRDILYEVNAAQRTALQLATRENHVVVVKKLIMAGSDVNFRSASDGRSALHIASGEGHNTVVNLLMEEGADKDAQSKPHPSRRILDKEAKTPLMEAIQNGHFPVVETLLSKDADISPEIAHIHEDCDTPMGAIEFAALRGDNDIMTALLSKVNGDWCLQYAIILACRRGHIAVVKTLLDNGCDVKESGYDFDQPLICAAEGGYDAIVTLLLENGAKPTEERWSDGETPITMAAKGGHLRTTKALLNAGARHERALECALLGEHIPVVKAILDSSTEVDTRELGELLVNITSGEYSGTPEFTYEALLVLLQHGAPVNFTALGGKTSLHWFVRSEDCSEAIVDLLLRWGADETLKDRNGKTPVDVLASNWGLDLAVSEPVHHLLVNAPKDRAWRRRGWLVILRARKLKDMEAMVMPEPKNSRGGGGSDGQDARLVDFVVRLEEEGVFREVVAFL